MPVPVERTEPATACHTAAAGPHLQAGGGGLLARPCLLRVRQQVWGQEVRVGPPRLGLHLGRWCGPWGLVSRGQLWLLRRTVPGTWKDLPQSALTIAHPHQRALEEQQRPTSSTNLISIELDPSREILPPSPPGAARTGRTGTSQGWRWRRRHGSRGARSSAARCGGKASDKQIGMPLGPGWVQAWLIGICMAAPRCVAQQTPGRRQDSPLRGGCLPHAQQARPQHPPEALRREVVKHSERPGQVAEGVQVVALVLHWATKARQGNP